MSQIPRENSEVVYFDESEINQVETSDVVNSEELGNDKDLRVAASMCRYCSLFENFREPELPLTNGFVCYIHGKYSGPTEFSYTARKLRELVPSSPCASDEDSLTACVGSLITALSSVDHGIDPKRILKFLEKKFVNVKGTSLRHQVLTDSLIDIILNCDFDLEKSVSSKKTRARQKTAKQKLLSKRRKLDSETQIRLQLENSKSGPKSNSSLLRKALDKEAEDSEPRIKFYKDMIDQLQKKQNDIESNYQNTLTKIQKGHIHAMNVMLKENVELKGRLKRSSVQYKDLNSQLTKAKDCISKLLEYTPKDSPLVAEASAIVSYKGGRKNHTNTTVSNENLIYSEPPVTPAIPSTQIEVCQPDPMADEAMITIGPIDVNDEAPVSHADPFDIPVSLLKATNDASSVRVKSEPESDYNSSSVTAAGKTDEKNFNTGFRVKIEPGLESAPINNQKPSKVKVEPGDIDLNPDECLPEVKKEPEDDTPVHSMYMTTPSKNLPKLSEYLSVPLNPYEFKDFDANYYSDKSSDLTEGIEPNSSDKIKKEIDGDLLSASQQQLAKPISRSNQPPRQISLLTSRTLKKQVLNPKPAVRSLESDSQGIVLSVKGKKSDSEPKVRFIQVPEKFSGYPIRPRSFPSFVEQANKRKKISQKTETRIMKRITSSVRSDHAYCEMVVVEMKPC